MRSSSVRTGSFLQIFEEAEVNSFCLGTNCIANAALPLIGEGFWSLAIVTVVLSLVEIALVKRWYEVRPVVVRWTGNSSGLVGMADEPEAWSPQSSLLLLAGNLVSTFVGSLFLTRFHAAQSWILGGHPLERASLYIVFVCLAAFVLSILVEWPFFSRAIKDRPLSREGLFVCAGCNVLTGLFIFVWFSLTGMRSLITDSQIVSALSIAQQPYGTVCFVDPQSEEIYSIRTDGAELKDLGRKVPPGCEISIERASNGDAKLYIERGDQRIGAPVKDFGAAAKAADPAVEDRIDYDARYFGAKKAQKYSVSYGPDPYDGLSVWTPARIYKLALDSKPLSMRWGHATVLPTNQAVAQVGSQIVLIDLDSGKLAILANGESPTVAMQE